MVAPDFGRLLLHGEIAEAHDRATAVRSGQMQTIMERRGSKLDHLRELTSGDKGAIGFRHHKYTIEGQPADVCISVAQANSPHRFDGMNKKSRKGYHTLPLALKISL